MHIADYIAIGVLIACMLGAGAMALHNADNPILKNREIVSVMFATEIEQHKRNVGGAKCTVS